MATTTGRIATIASAMRVGSMYADKAFADDFIRDGDTAVEVSAIVIC